MPKTIAITPSWYWPEGVPRVVGIPPFGVHELCVERQARDHPEALSIVAGTERLSAGEVASEVERTAAALAPGGTVRRRAVLAADSTLEGVLLLLASLAAGLHLRVLGAGEDAAQVAAEFAADLVLRRRSDVPAAASATERLWRPMDFREPAVAIGGARGTVNHSHRSLIAGAIGLAAFFGPQAGRPWLTTLPLGTWEGLASVLLPLYLGSPLVLAPGDGESWAAAIAEEKVGYLLQELEAATRATHEARREVKRARDVLDMILLSTTGCFDPGDRQRVGKVFRCPSLTLFGMPETGAIFASHPSWYLDESVGIPVSNAHVVPADPRTGAAIQALWEQVESAEVTVQGPALLCGYEGAQHPERFVDGRFRTGLIASSDANGMIYLLPE